MPTAMNQLAGIYPPIATPLTADEALDPAGLRRVIRHVLAGGVHGIVVLGSTGEGPVLPARTKRQAIEVAVDEVAGRAPVIAGVGEPSTALAVEATIAARAAGADGVLVLPPFYFPVDQPALLRHYRAVVADGGLPVLIYHFPATTKVSVEPETIATLAREGGIVGMKDSSSNFPSFQRIVDLTRHLPGFAPLQGNERLLFVGTVYGGRGSIAVMAQIAPRPIVAIYEAAARGDLATAQARHDDLTRLMAAMGPGGYPGVKAALEALGLCARWVAAPAAPLDDDAAAALRARLAATGLLPELAGAPSHA